MKSKIKINRPDDLMPLINKYARKKQEHFGVVALNSQYEVIGQKCLFIGTDNKCAVSSRILFWYLCKKEANAFKIFSFLNFLSCFNIIKFIIIIINHI